jgi:hypothetical protein
MIRTNIPGVAFGCLVKPLAAAFDAQLAYAGEIPCDEFDTRFAHLSNARLQSRSLMEGPVDGNAVFNATRYRCF